MRLGVLLVTAALVASSGAAEAKVAPGGPERAVKRKVLRESDLYGVSVSSCNRTSGKRWTCTYIGAEPPQGLCLREGKARVARRPHSWRVRLLRAYIVPDEC
jgi:hypothetical protein